MRYLVVGAVVFSVVTIAQAAQRTSPTGATANHYDRMQRSINVEYDKTKGQPKQDIQSINDKIKDKGQRPCVKVGC